MQTCSPQLIRCRRRPMGGVRAALSHQLSLLPSHIVGRATEIVQQTTLSSPNEWRVTELHNKRISLHFTSVSLHIPHLSAESAAVERACYGTGGAVVSPYRSGIADLLVIVCTRIYMHWIYTYPLHLFSSSNVRRHPLRAALPAVVG